MLSTRALCEQDVAGVEASIEHQVDHDEYCIWIPLVDIQYCVMETTTTVLMARKRGLRRVAGLADILTLRLEALVPPDRESRVVIVE